MRQAINAYFIGDQSKSETDQLLWKRAAELPDSLVKRDRHVPKTMVVIFFRSSGHTLIHAVEKGITKENINYQENCLITAFGIHV